MVEGDAADDLCRSWCDGIFEETGSPVAEALLDDWATAVRRFTELMPTDYKRVLAAKEEAEAEGLSDDETPSRSTRLCMAEHVSRLPAPEVRCFPRAR